MLRLIKIMSHNALHNLTLKVSNIYGFINPTIKVHEHRVLLLRAEPWWFHHVVVQDLPIGRTQSAKLCGLMLIKIR